MKRLALALLIIISGAACHTNKPSSPTARDDPQTDPWCPGTHIPYVDAEHCAGMSSCDRAFLVGHVIPCPKE
jgi:hypothetical protein